MGSSFNIVGEPDDHEHTYNARVTAVSGGYERLMGTPIIRGRMVSDDDAVNSPFVVAINETLARKFFAGKDPLGQRIDVGGAKTGMVKPYTIVENHRRSGG